MEINMIREMSLEDVQAVWEMEQMCFPDPWSIDSIKEGFFNRFDTWIVLEEEEEFLGYCAFRILAGEGELFRIAVLPAFRGRGLSKKLMEYLVKYSSKMNAFSISLEVRESNIIAKNLYKTYGFLEEGIRKAYYRNPCESAIIMCNRRI
jgi:ribosomal-protein-alanine N-acetyltransferase